MYLRDRVTAVAAMLGIPAFVLLAVVTANTDTDNAPHIQGLHALQPDVRELAANGEVDCFTMPGRPATGVHDAQHSRVATDHIRALIPEARVYETQPDGAQRLVGIKYLALGDDPDVKRDDPRQQTGHTAHISLAPLIPGRPVNSSTHVWLWVTNPVGRFDPWSQPVHCPQPMPY